MSVVERLEALERERRAMLPSGERDPTDFLIKTLRLTPEQFAALIDERKAMFARGECDHGIQLADCAWCRSIKIDLTPRR
jgi:hypothetical protein